MEYRKGVLVKPYERLNQDQLKGLHKDSLQILADTGIWCHNHKAAKLFRAHGAAVSEATENESTVWRIHIPPGLVEEAVAQAPSSFVLGAREPANRLMLDAEVPRVYFGSGSETNTWIYYDETIRYAR